MRKTLSKAEKARNIVDRHQKSGKDFTTGQVVKQIMKTCDLNDLAAKTYYYNAVKALEKAAPATKKVRKARKHIAQHAAAA